MHRMQLVRALKARASLKVGGRGQRSVYERSKANKHRKAIRVKKTIRRYPWILPPCLIMFIILKLMLFASIYADGSSHARGRSVPPDPF
mmetsp:Transcript_24419/g.45673  ORF Transcript_24419/g.45673 Transcript_24419/m.45673 type:complete len:89 (-) Transcript_24419:388-654(-)